MYDFSPRLAWNLADDPTIDLLYHLLYTPMMWSDYVNGEIYQFVAFVLQASQAHNITIDGGAKYNVPSGSIVINGMGKTSTPNLTSYATAAIIGADDFNDDNTTLDGLFDIIVNTTRQVTPSCMFLVGLSSVFFFFIDLPSTKSELSGTMGMYRRSIPWVHCDESPHRYTSYGWPVRSVERLPPFTPDQLKNPVLVIGNSVSTCCATILIIP